MIGRRASLSLGYLDAVSSLEIWIRCDDCFFSNLIGSGRRDFACVLKASIVFN